MRFDHVTCVCVCVCVCVCEGVRVLGVIRADTMTVIHPVGQYECILLLCL